MKIEDLEAVALNLDPKSRARLAERLLASLDTLAPDECARIWAKEGTAARRRVGRGFPDEPAGRRGLSRGPRADLTGARHRQRVGEHELNEVAQYYELEQPVLGVAS